MKQLMRFLALLIVVSGVAFGQCGSAGHLILNPVSGQYDCTANTGVPPSGAAGGDLSGTYPNPTVAKIEGVAVKSGLSCAADGYVLTWVAATSQFECLVASTANARCTFTAATTCSITGLTGVANKAVVSCYDNSSTLVEIIPNDFAGTTADTLVINFSAAQTGYCNASTGVGATGATGATGPAGSSAFSALTTSSNTTATMTVDSGASIVPSGTGIIDSTKIRGLAVKSGMTCASDGFVLTWVAANTQFECLTSSGGVTSITGTANQITASAATGAVTLSIPTNPTLPGTTTGTFSGNLTGNASGSAGSVTSLSGHASTELSDTASLAYLAGTNAFTGSDSFSKDLTLSGTLSPTALAGDVNDYNPTNCATSLALRIDGGASDRNITGLQCAASAPSDGRIITIVNIGTTNNLVLKNASGSSSSANQFLLPADTTLPINTSMALRYDGTSSKWRPWSRALSNTGVTAGTYGGVTVDVAGRVTSATTTLPLANGGLNAALTASNGGIFYSTASAGAILSGTATAGLALLSGASTTPTWSASAPGLLGASQTWTVNGAVSAPGQTFNGTWFTGGSATTTKPYVLIETTGATSTGWSTSGTGLGVNAASGFTGNLIDLQLNGVSEFKVSSAGLVTANGNIQGSTIVGQAIRTAGTSATLSVQTQGISTASIPAVSMATGTMSQTSGTFAAVQITPTYNQASGTAVNTDLLINRTETAVGSGAQLFQDWQVAGSSKASLDHLGQFSGLNLRATPVAVGSLPSCVAGTEGVRATVNDSNAASFTAGIGAVVANGGTTHVPVVCDGTNWRIG